MTIDDGANLPLKVIKNSFCGSFLDALMKNSRVTLDNQFNWTGGLTAAFMIEAEMRGVSAVSFKAIVDQHFITTETLQAYTPVVSDLLPGLGTSKLDEIYKYKQFKPVLKEMNQKSNGIFN